MCGCRNTTFYGQSQRRFFVRASEHLRITTLTVRFVYLLICFVLDNLLQSICFQMFCSKISIAFENTYLLSRLFHCVDVSYIEFRSCKTFTAITSVAKMLLIEAPYEFI